MNWRELQAEEARDALEAIAEARAEHEADQEYDGPAGYPEHFAEYSRMEYGPGINEW